MQEMLNSANMALAMAPLLTQGAIDALALHGTEEQREVYLGRMVSGEWAGTMNLTEPEAGSDVGALRTKAVQPGRRQLPHHRPEDLHHLRRPRPHRQHRPPGAGPHPRRAAGHQGHLAASSSPSSWSTTTARLGERNDVKVVSIEHKMGIKASPTCVLAYGDDGDGAVGYLVGEEQAGMR